LRLEEGVELEVYGGWQFVARAGSIVHTRRDGTKLYNWNVKLMSMGVNGVSTADFSFEMVYLRDDTKYCITPTPNPALSKRLCD
jgi:hypothetical protein